MAHASIATKPNLAKELESYAQIAADLEDLVRYTRAVLTAVYSGGLFDQLPPDEEARERHNSGCVILSELQRRMDLHEKEDDARPGTDLSIALRVMASDAASGRLSTVAGGSND